MWGDLSCKPGGRVFGGHLAIGHLHDGVILLLRPESFRVLLPWANYLLLFNPHWDYQISIWKEKQNVLGLVAKRRHRENGPFWRVISVFSSLSHCKFIWSGVILHYILPINVNPFLLIWRRISQIKVFFLTKSEQNILRNQFASYWLFSTKVCPV